MIRTLLGIIILLHGLVHLWFVVLSCEWTQFQPDMGWTCQSWFFSNLLKNPEKINLKRHP